MNKDEALKLALFDIERYQTKRQDFDRFENTLIKIKEALAQPDHIPDIGKLVMKEVSLPEQEPVEWQGRVGSCWRTTTPTKQQPTQKLRAEYLATIKRAEGAPAYEIRALFTSPPARKWVGLNDEQYIQIADTTFHAGLGIVAFSKAIEAKLKEKNYDN